LGRQKEDKKFITGKDRYTDDSNRIGQLHGVIHALAPLGVTDMSMPATPEKV
jgi:hypothetical protein